MPRFTLCLKKMSYHCVTYWWDLGTYVNDFCGIFASKCKERVTFCQNFRNMPSFLPKKQTLIQPIQQYMLLI